MSNPRAAIAEPDTTTGGALTPDVGGRTAGSIPATGAKVIPFGIHFGLDEALYHADPGLGSGDIRLLAKNPYSYWFYSAMNPMRPSPPEKEHFVYGRALHKLVFEGREAFDRQFMSGENQEGMTTAEKSASTRATNATAALAGKLALKWDDYARILLAGAMITKNPHLSSVFSGGHSEVSFFWMRAGVRLKARFDYLKCTKRQFGMVAANGDLKSVANEKQNDFATECYNAIARYRYDAQAAHYLDGLMTLPRAVKAGAVFIHDGRQIDQEWIDRFLSPGLLFGWQWLFLQKTGAPITHSMTLSPNNQILDTGRDVVRRGIENYKRCMETFGTEEMWISLEEPREATIESMPGWFGR